MQALIEYKLAKSKKDVPIRIDELSADVHGYGPTEDWKRFYAVIHVMDGVVPQHDVDFHVKRLGFPDTWRVFVTH